MPRRPLGRRESFSLGLVTWLAARTSGERGKLKPETSEEEARKQQARASKTSKKQGQEHEVRKEDAKGKLQEARGKGKERFEAWWLDLVWLASTGQQEQEGQGAKPETSERKKVESKRQGHARRARSRGKSTKLERKTQEASCKKQDANGKGKEDMEASNSKQEMEGKMQGERAQDTAAGKRWEELQLARARKQRGRS